MGDQTIARTIRALFFLSGIYNPCEFEPRHSWSYTQWHTTVDRTSLDEWSARRRDLYLTTHITLTTNIHASGGIRISNPSRRSSADPRLRPLSHWDRHTGTAVDVPVPLVSSSLDLPYRIGFLNPYYDTWYGSLTIIHTVIRTNTHVLARFEPATTVLSSDNIAARITDRLKCALPSHIPTTFIKHTKSHKT